MQLIWVVVAGAALAWLYLAAFHMLLCGPNAPRMSLLFAIIAFIDATAIVLAVMWVLSDGRLERFVAALVGFVAARALFDRTVFRNPEEESAEAFGGESAEPLGQQPLDRLA